MWRATGEAEGLWSLLYGYILTGSPEIKPMRALCHQCI
jgi:hypothetical protein